MRQLGFQEYLRPELQGHIITSFRYPDDANFNFDDFYTRLNDLGYVIYPGKVSGADCFRIGHIGRLYPSDMQNLLAAIRQTLCDMDVSLLEGNGLVGNAFNPSVLLIIRRIGGPSHCWGTDYPSVVS